MALLLSLSHSAAAWAKVEFAWSVDAGVSFLFHKHQLRWDKKPPAFEQDILGARFTFNALGILKLNDYVELNALVDMGELTLGQRTRNKVGEFAVLLNDLRLNWSAQEQRDIDASVQSCRTAAASQGIPAYDCAFFSPALTESLFLREIYARFYVKKWSWLTLDVGVRDLTLGRGYLFDDYALGLFFKLDLSSKSDKTLPLKFEFHAFLPDISLTPEGKMSPVLHAEFTYVRSKTASLSFFATYMYDGNRMAAKAMLPLWQELMSARINEVISSHSGQPSTFFCRNNYTQQQLAALYNTNVPGQSSQLIDTFIEICDVMPKSQGHHLWVGMHGKGKLDKLEGSGSLIFYAANSTMSMPAVSLTQLTPSFNLPRDFEIQGLGFLAELTGKLRWSNEWASSLFFVVSSGDHLDPSRKQFYLFLGISPQNNYSQLFFNGGINAYSFQQGLGVSSVSGKGLLAVGTTVEHQQTGKLDMKLSASLMWSVVPSTYLTATVPSSGQFYGAEVNFVGNYHLKKWWKLVMGGDLFMPGDFFAGTNAPPVVFRFHLGFQFSFSSL